MDFQKTKLFLDKLNREFARLSKDPDNLVRLDVDIMASYVRDLYDALYDTPVTSPAVVTKPEPAVRVEQLIPPPTIAEEVRPVIALPEVPVSQPVVEVKEAPVERPVVVTPPVSVTPPVPSNSVIDADIEALFEEKVAKELSDRLSELPITDLKKAFALNDRLLYTRELFGGDATAFDSAISEINSIGNFADAQNYMIRNCVRRFEWNDTRRVEKAKGFIRLVRRRFK